MSKVASWAKAEWRERGWDFVMDAVGCIAFVGGVVMALLTLMR